MARVKITSNAIKFVLDYYLSMGEKFGYDEEHANIYFRRILDVGNKLDGNTIFRKPQVKKYADAGYMEYLFIPKPRNKGRTSWYFECKKDEQGIIVIHEIVPTAMMHDSWFLQVAASFLFD